MLSKINSFLSTRNFREKVLMILLLVITMSIFSYKIIYKKVYLKANTVEKEYQTAKHQFNFINKNLNDLKKAQKFLAKNIPVNNQVTRNKFIDQFLKKNKLTSTVKQFTKNPDSTVLIIETDDSNYLLILLKNLFDNYLTVTNFSIKNDNGKYIGSYQVK